MQYFKVVCRSPYDTGLLHKTDDRSTFLCKLKSCHIYEMEERRCLITFFVIAYCHDRLANEPEYRRLSWKVIVRTVWSRATWVKVKVIVSFVGGPSFTKCSSSLSCSMYVIPYANNNKDLCLDFNLIFYQTFKSVPYLIKVKWKVSTNPYRDQRERAWMGQFLKSTALMKIVDATLLSTLKQVEIGHMYYSMTHYQKDVIRRE